MSFLVNVSLLTLWSGNRFFASPMTRSKKKNKKVYNVQKKDEYISCNWWKVLNNNSIAIPQAESLR